MVDIIYRFSLYFIFYIIIDYLFISLDDLQKKKKKKIIRLLEKLYDIHYLNKSNGNLYFINYLKHI
jgi:hypothetical protein